MIRDESDEIRTMRTKQEALHIAADQLLQIAEKRTKKGRENDRDALWTQIWEQDMQQKLEEEERRIAKAKENRMAVEEKRKEQIQELRDRKKKEEELKKEEEALQREYWDMKKQEELQEQQEKELEKKMKFREYQRFNKVNEAKRLREAAEKREEELAFIAEVLEREKNDEDAEKAAKARERAELIAQRQQQLEEMMSAKEDEKELDRLIALEDEKEYQKRKAVWDKEDAWRKQLLKDVIADRERHIQMKREQKLKEIEDNYKDAEDIMRDVARQNAEEERKAKERALKERECADSQIKQMQEKRDKRTAADLKEREFDIKDAEYNNKRIIAEDEAKAELAKERDLMQKYVHDLQEDVEEQPLSQPKARQLQYKENLAREERELTRKREYQATLTRSMAGGQGGGAGGAGGTAGMTQTSTASYKPIPGATPSGPYAQANPYDTGVTRGIGTNPRVNQRTRGKVFERTSLW